MAMSLLIFDSIVLYQQMYHRGAVIEKNAPSRPLACALLGEYEYRRPQNLAYTLKLEAAVFTLSSELELGLGQD